MKTEPHWAILQGQSAHDTWDYVSLQPETLHNDVAMSDRGIPQLSHQQKAWHSYLPDDQRRGQCDVCPFHWKPVAGESLAGGDEAQKDRARSDFHRRELWESIERATSRI